MSIRIEERLVDFVQTVTTDADIDAHTDLVINNYLDSLLLMDLVILIENETGVSLGGEDISPQNFRTIANLARIVEQKSNARMFGRFAA